MSEKLFNNQYKIINELGRQTARRTFLAEDIQTQAKVVVKILYLGKDFDWQDLKLFEREAETLQQINHPAIPRYLDYFEFETENDKGFALVQTYVDAKSLEQQLQDGRRFSEEEVMQLAQSLLDILDYLHQQQPPIIHRDIKPSNILMKNRSAHHVGDVYLVDFGSVQNLAHQEGGTITVVGTYGYMPPEQFGGRAKPASDLYSLGATLIYLITGLHPTELPQTNLCIQFRQVAKVSQRFGDWLEWMIEPSLDRRFQTAKIAQEAIDNPPPRVSKNLKYEVKKTVPIGTKIQIFKTDDKLEIILPPTGFGTGLIALISCIAPFAIGTNFVSGSIFTYPLSMVGLFVFLLQLSAIAILILLVLLALYKRTHLIFTQKNLHVINKLFAWNFWQKMIPIDYLEKITMIVDVYNTGIKENLILDTKNKPGSRNKIFKDFDFDCYSNLTIAEREWLAKEISNWLNLPIVESKW